MNGSAGKRILIIEDDSHIAEGLDFNLTLQGYEVAIAADGAAGLHLWQTWNPSLIVLDIMLPEIDGLTVLKQIRNQDERIPILVLSAKGTEDDRIRGLSYGVDDYLAKPFNLDEFLLRIERLLTKADWYHAHPQQPDEPVPAIYEFGDNKINFKTFAAIGNGKEITLTEQETKLLKLFIANPGNPLKRETLLEVCWGYSRKASSRTVDNFIVRFRKYFEKKPRMPVFFKSLRSVGYVFDPNGETGTD